MNLAIPTFVSRDVSCRGSFDFTVRPNQTSRLGWMGNKNCAQRNFICFNQRTSRFDHSAIGSVSFLNPNA